MHNNATNSIANSIVHASSANQSLIDIDVNNLVAGNDLVDHLDALCHFAEARMNSVEMCRALTAMANKELRTARVLTCVCHRKNAAIMALIFAACFAFDLPSWPTRSAASGATTLNDKVWDDSVKVQSFIEPLLCEFTKISDGIWRIGVEELDDHIALGGLDGCC